MPTTQSEDPNEQVDHPRHYNAHPSGFECIDLIEQLPANLSHAFKYIWRCGLKTANDPLRELRSAEWYVRREIKRAARFGRGEPSPGMKAVWTTLAQHIVDDAKTRRDLLAFCLGYLLRDDLEGLAWKLEREIASIA